MAVRLFEAKEHASAYWKYRVSPSEKLTKNILTFFKKNSDLLGEVAVDVGCGSGQGTALLGPHFTQVVGTDISPAQLDLAILHNTAANISYRQCPAEELPFRDESVDLVTTLSAFHWFDHPRFLQEAHRILKPKGCLAILNYGLDMELSYGDCSEELNHICKEFYAALQPHRHPKLGDSTLTLYERVYNTLQYPVKEWQPSFWDRLQVSISKYIGMVQSFSAYQNLLKKDPEEAQRLSHDITRRLMSVMKVTSTETEVILGVRYFYLLACKP
ncbi:putative methyltransferase DDB_G0268948 [Brachyhypopomus gauderio]|uniref:putative methyltransferase DDB_G0268948 n=1 Tax=Brachyhypopomus gauderio TaxID=698409 RepID=UPI004042D4A6